jgi:hypothetical protein
MYVKPAALGLNAAIPIVGTAAVVVGVVVAAAILRDAVAAVAAGA